MGYLDDYAEREARYARIGLLLKRTLQIGVALFVVGGSLYLWFKNYAEEKRVEAFLEALQRADYEAAYTFWGCTVERPCASYSYRDFMEDWGPASSLGKVSSFRMGRSQERGSGVIVAVRINNREEPVTLWVEKRDGVVGFAPPF
jgi:hypothetical protein